MSHPEQPLYKLHHPYLGGYTFIENVSLEENTQQLVRFLRKERWRDFFAIHQGHKLLRKWSYGDFAFSLLGLLLGFVFIGQIRHFFSSPSIYNALFFAFTTMLVLFPLLKYGGIWLYADLQAKNSPLIAKLQEHYKTYWLEISLFPMLSHVTQQIELAETSKQQLQKEYSKMLTLSEAPNLPNKLLQRTQEPLVLFQNIIKAYELAIDAFGSLEDELFFIKQKKEQEETLNQQIANISKKPLVPIDQKLFLEEIDRLKPLIEQVDNFFIACTKEPEKCIKQHDVLVKKIERHKNAVK